MNEKINDKIEMYEKKIAILHAVQNVLEDLNSTLVNWYTTTDSETQERIPLDWKKEEYEITMDLIDYINKVYLK